ncbi:DNA-binding transcriptional regulator, FadR family [Salinibacillus kushneri]|uniref:DNA-binding transcriptional regulator, FadR family n=1 Tax=Salinibacillus kushneri TaxID=237682 RepID=A0A1I0H952_9BACI|nr:GntR family transcriptional regulator [Salinibacillus kushneri]SET79443.1 DNA-binding transcriptional regulator, FadR family [Salinibacillus kushneri]
MTNAEKAKVYQEVLEHIRLFIEEHRLSPGDRLPSERDLSEELNASRSSIREALRAIELLGLIETKHGEGTFLKNYRPYHTVSLLSTFILNETRTKNELFEVKMLLEQNAAKLAMEHIDQTSITRLKEIVTEQHSRNNRHFHFFKTLFRLCDNDLLLKIWQLIEEFSRTVDIAEYHKEAYLELIEGIQDKDNQKIQYIIGQLYHL